MSKANRTHERGIAFCAAIAETANIGRACKAVGIGRTTAYDWRDADPDFAAMWDRAMTIGVTALEDEAKRRAFEGTEEPIIHQGQIQYEVREKLTKGGRPIIDRVTKQPKMEVVRNEDGSRKMATVRKYSDSLVPLLLKAHGGEKYRDNSKIEMAGSLDLRHLDNDELEDEIAKLQAQLATSALPEGGMPTESPAPGDDEPDDYVIPD